MADTGSTPLAAKGKACDAREKTLLAIASTGAAVNAQWAAHQTMMANKAHTSEGAYHDRWVAMVTGARAPLERYAAAAAALGRAPACSA